MKSAVAPDTVEELLDPNWLTDALGDLPSGYRVVEVLPEETSKTIASKVRFRVRAEGPGGNPYEGAYCAKVHFDGDAFDSLKSETRFYRDLSPKLGVATPRAHYAAVDPVSDRSIVIMDDIAALGGRFLGAEEPYPPETARRTLRQLARLHAATWGATADGWLSARIRPMVDGYPGRLLQDLLDDGRGPHVSTELRDALTVKQAVLGVADVAPTCVIHGDAHSGNAYVDRHGGAGWLDWQVVQAGHWATDVSYHLATALDTETRRGHEKDLLEYYLRQLGAMGVEPPAWDEAWDRYRTHFPYGYFLWAITRISSRAVVLIHIPRLAAAMEDHHTLARLGVT